VSATVAIAAGLGSALAYGAGTAGQHAAAYTGTADAGRLLELLRNRCWLLATAGDLVGIVLQVLALANGAVVLVQPLLVLSLPVAVLLRSWFGAPRPSATDLRNCAALVGGLALFFVLLGEPSRGRLIGPQATAWIAAGAVLLGGLAIAAMRGRPPVLRAVTFGAVAGCWFGVVSVLIEAVSSIWERAGLAGFGRAAGLVPLIGVIVLAVGAYLLVQIGFQLGPLEASFPPNLILDPVVAVVLGAALLGEHVRLGSGRSLGYLVCVGLVGWAAFRLAGPAPHDLELGHRSGPSSLSAG
jgi:hypothetical protein